jgi:ferritin-like metal-binding protein YciE
MGMKSLEDAFHDELRDVLSAEQQLVKAMPKMAKKATSSRLQQALKDHLSETEKHVERVEMAFEETGKTARAKKCEAMAGIIEECESVLSESAAEDVMDAMIIAAAQKAEHYEIATYGTLCTWAELLGYETAKTELGKNLDEEEAADKKLTLLSKKINKAALVLDQA